MTRTLVFIVYPDFQLLDVAGPVSAFEHASRIAPGAYEIVLASERGGTVPSSAGIALPTQAFAQVHAADTMVVVGGEGVSAAIGHEPLVGFIASLGARAQRIASVCSGAFLLAQAGLLRGRKATTHWQRSADFRRRFADVKLDDDRIFINDGKVWTSAGISAGIDLALALIANDLGEALARQVARQLVLYYRRPGGQSQYSALLEMDAGTNRFTALLDYIRANLDRALTVDELAHEACMSRRHFARLFTKEVGVTPARAVERLRVEAASAALESGTAAVAVIARQCGFMDAERMRRAFIRLKGMPPSALRR